MKILKRKYKVKTICSAKENVFKEFSLCEYHDLKGAFIGQDFGNKL